MCTMLFAVEGGGFFSSSASGYSDGLTLLLLGRRKEEQPMKVSPWNHCQLVLQDIDSDVQLASKANRVSCKCTSLVCFGRESAGYNGPSPPQVGPSQQSDSADTSVSERGVVCNETDTDVEIGGSTYLKSSLKKNTANHAEAVQGDIMVCEESHEEQGDTIVHMDRRKVQWTDACGKELAEVREFEVSEEETSSGDFEHGVLQKCQCVIQ